MKRWAVALGALLVVVVAAISLVWLRPDPTGRATGAAGPSPEALGLWHELQRFEDPYLVAWSERLAESPHDTLEVLTVFHELATNVTGYGGVWRKTVPNEYFGCAADPETPVCTRLAAAEKNFARWDTLQEAISEIDSERAARGFLRHNHKAMVEYLGTYVPADRSFSAVQATPFFAENIAAALP